jgi:hypothetical protein
MSNYYEASRSNYFAVKNLEAFKTAIEAFPIELVSKTAEDGETLVALLGDYEGGFAWTYYDEDTEDDIEIVWEDIFKEHLADDTVAIFMGTGSEKLRYLSGWAVAYNNKGETVAINLDEIYAKAESLLLGKNITRAEY